MVLGHDFFYYGQPDANGNLPIDPIGEEWLDCDGNYGQWGVLNGVADGVLFGNPGQLVTQAIAVSATILYSGVVSFVLLKIISLFKPPKIFGLVYRALKRGVRPY